MYIREPNRFGIKGLLQADTREAWEQYNDDNYFPPAAMIHVEGECLYLTGNVYGATFSEGEELWDRIEVTPPKKV